LAHPDELAAELRWRWQWLDARGYQPTVHEAAVPTLGGNDQAASARETAAETAAPTFGAPTQTEEAQAEEEAQRPTEPDVVLVRAQTTATGTPDGQDMPTDVVTEPVHRDDEQPVTFGAAHGD